jgi:hypothetical protein
VFYPPVAGASRIFPLVAVLFPGVEKRVLLEFAFAYSAFVAADKKKSLMPLPAIWTAVPANEAFYVGARKNVGRMVLRSGSDRDDASIGEVSIDAKPKIDGIVLDRRPS